MSKRAYIVLSSTFCAIALICTLGALWWWALFGMISKIGVAFTATGFTALLVSAVLGILATEK